MEKTAFTALLLTGLCIPASLVREHFFIDTKMTWSDAAKYCNQEYNQLSKIESKIEAEKVLTTPGYDQSVLAWIGLHRFDGILGPYWRWSGFIYPQFQNWFQGEPNDVKGNEECVVMDKNGWYDIRCDGKYPFFCYEDMREMIVVQEKKTWEEALDYCRANYTDLTSLVSEKELRLAVQKSQGTEEIYLWTGMRFLAGYWLWVTGEPLAYNGWPGMEPPQCPAKPFRCGALNVTGGVWEHRSCEEKLSFICYKME